MEASKEVFLDEQLASKKAATVEAEKAKDTLKNSDAVKAPLDPPKMAAKYLDTSTAIVVIAVIEMQCKYISC